MPLYEYECFLCRYRFERIQRADAEPIRECPSCGGQVRRLLGTPALQFKGSGWYVTDYGGKGKEGPTAKSGGEGPSEKAAPADGESSSGGKAPSKGEG
jgi:putative FmdB family regulatory protein